MRTALTWMLIAALASPSLAAQGGGARPAPAGGNTLPPQATSDFNTSLETYLDGELAQVRFAANTSGPSAPSGIASVTATPPPEPFKDPSGALVSDSAVKGLILTRDATAAQLDDYAKRLEGTGDMSRREKIDASRGMIDEASAARDAYRRMRDAEVRADDLKNEQRGAYESLKRDAKSLRDRGATDRASELDASADRSNYGQFLQRQQEYREQLDHNPMLGFEIDGVPMWQALLTTAFEAGSVGSSRQLSQVERDQAYVDTFNRYMRAGAERMRELAKKIREVHRIEDLWQFSTPRFQRQRDAVAGSGAAAQSVMPRLYVETAQAVGAGGYASKSADDMLWNGLSEGLLFVIQVGSFLIPVWGGLISLGISTLQFGRAAISYDTAVTQTERSRTLAPVTTYEHVITDEERQAAAGKGVIFSAVGVVADAAAVTHARFSTGGGGTPGAATPRPDVPTPPPSAAPRAPTAVPDAPTVITPIEVPSATPTGVSRQPTPGAGAPPPPPPPAPLPPRTATPAPAPPATLDAPTVNVGARQSTPGGAPAPPPPPPPAPRAPTAVPDAPTVITPIEVPSATPTGVTRQPTPGAAPPPPPPPAPLPPRTATPAPPGTLDTPTVNVPGRQPTPGTGTGAGTRVTPIEVPGPTQPTGATRQPTGPNGTRVETPFEPPANRLDTGVGPDDFAKQELEEYNAERALAEKELPKEDFDRIVSSGARGDAAVTFRLNRERLRRAGKEIHGMRSEWIEYPPFDERRKLGRTGEYRRVASGADQAFIEEYRRIQEIETRRLLGKLTDEDIAWLRQRSGGDPAYFDRLPERGFVLEDANGDPIRADESIHWMLTPEQAQGLKEAYRARTATGTAAASAAAPPRPAGTGSDRTPSGGIPTPNSPSPPGTADRDEANRNATGSTSTTRLTSPGGGSNAAPSTAVLIAGGNFTPTTVVPPVRITLLPGSGGAEDPKTFVATGPRVIDLVEHRDRLTYGGGGIVSDVQRQDGDETDTEVPPTRVRLRGEAGVPPPLLDPLRKLWAALRALLSSRGGPSIYASARGFAPWSRIEREAQLPTASAAAAPPVRAFVTSLGVSTGEAFEMQIVNDGPAPVRVRGDGFVLEPIALSDQIKARSEMQQAVASRTPTKVRINAYCLEFLKQPPTPGMMFRLAAADVQQQFAPMRHILKAARTLEKAGLIRPDSNPIEYMHSIKQWAVWTKEQKFNLKSFGTAFVEHAKKNMRAAGRQWTKPIEEALIGAVPHRFEEITQILKMAEQEAGR